MRKRLLSVLLALVMLLSLVPAVGPTASAADTPITVGPSDGSEEVTITIKGVKAEKLAGDVQYEVKYKDGTTGWPPYAPFDGVERKTPWQVKETGRYLLKNYIAYNGNTLADYDDRFYDGMTYKLVIAGNSVQFKGADKIKLVFENCGIVSTSNAMQKETINDHTCYTLDVMLGGEMQKHGLKVDQSIDHVYKRLERGMYEEIPLPGDRTLQIPEGTKLKFTVDKDYVSDGGVLKFFKGFQTEIVKPEYREYSSEDKGFIEGNFKVLSELDQEIVLQMGDRDTRISAVFTDDQLVRLNAIYLDVLPAIENGRQVTVVTPTSPEKREAYTPGLSSADKLATYTITGHTAGEWNPNDNSVYLYKKSTAANTKTDGKYTLDFSVKLNGNFYCSDRTTAIYINGKRVPENDIALTTGFGNSDSLPVYWNIENRKIESYGYTGWNMDFRLRDFASQYYENTGRYGLGLDAPMDFQKADDGNYRYTASDGNNSKEVRAYGSFEAASGQSCTVTFPVAVPQGIRNWNANHGDEEQIGFTFLQGATGGVFVKEDGGSYSPVEATYAVTTGSDGSVTATATFTPENGKMYRVMGSVAATWQGKIVATTPADNSFIYVKGVAKNYLTGSVVYTSAVRYGDNVSIGRTGGLASIDTAKLHYQWQSSSDGTAWTDISGATNGLLPKEKITASLVGKQIRVKVTADGYEGVIYSAAKEVGKGTNNAAPSAPQLTALEDATSTGTYTGFKIVNYDPNYEYVYSTSPITDTTTINWAANSISSDTVTGLNNGQTYYVYARAKETATHLAGSKVSSSSVALKAQNYLASITLSENGNAYAPYGVGNTIFLKVGETKELTVTGNPANANMWSDIYLRNNDTTSSHYSVTVGNTDSNKIDASTAETTAFSTHTIKITGNSAGSGTLIASSLNSGGEGTVYGRWNVYVYSDESPVSPLTVELIDPPTYADVTLSVGDTYTPDGGTPTISDIQTNPAGALSGYKVEWRVMTPAPIGGTPGYNANNNYISVDGNGVVTAIAANDDSSVNDTYKTVALCAVDKTTGSFVRPIASYHVTVTAATAPTLDSISVVPNEKTLKTGETVDLTAVKYPANAEGTITWESSGTSVATVDNDGKVTAVVAGTTTITATCGTKTATCTVYVIAEGHTHSYGDWEKLDDTFHSKTCTANDDMLVEKHNWEVDTTQTNTEPTLSAPGEKHYKCSDCGATKTDVLSQLTAITDAGVSVTAPAYGDTPSGAYASSGEFSVASVTWEPTVSGSFAANTVYTVKVELEASGSNRFTNATQFTINGQPAAVTPELVGDAYTDSVTLTYQFPATGSAPAPVPAYTVTVLDSKNGAVTADRKTASAGTTVTLTVTPDKGYTLETLSVLDKSGKEVKLTEKNGKYTFTMPASSVEVKATFMDDNTMLNFFVDVKAGDYFYDAVLWAAEKGITGGTDATHFTPNGVCTRAQAVTFLWRAAGSPAPKSTTMPFTDVAAGSYYEQAVLWAVENGITKGTTDTTFSPNATCSRAQIVTFLWRSQKSPAVGSVNPFTDVKSDAYYADAVLWAVKESVTSGTTATTFSPNADCTRAQIVTFIYRALAE